jgi:hypothetical protein
MPKAPIKTDKQGNKPKLSTKEKQQKKKDKHAAKDGSKSII